MRPATVACIIIVSIVLWVHAMLVVSVLLKTPEGAATLKAVAMMDMGAVLGVLGAAIWVRVQK